MKLFWNPLNMMSICVEWTGNQLKSYGYARHSKVIFIHGNSITPNRWTRKRKESVIKWSYIHLSILFVFFVHIFWLLLLSINDIIYTDLGNATLSAKSVSSFCMEARPAPNPQIQVFLTDNSLFLPFFFLLEAKGSIAYSG